jgi:hypothetical protein
MEMVERYWWLLIVGCWVGDAGSVLLLATISDNELTINFLLLSSLDVEQIRSQFCLFQSRA